MAIELRQHLKLAQQLIMTPQLQQAIKLLQLSRLELLETISEELQDNPLLEESQDVEPEKEDRAEVEQPANVEASVTEVTIEEKAKEDFDWENYLGDYSSGSKVRIEREEGRELPAVESRLVQKPSLDAHLLWQLHMSSLNEAQKKVGTMIIGNLGRDGYLKATTDEIAEMAECDEPVVEEVLHHIHGFDPLGVAARDLQECLLIQARNLELEDDLVVNIITNHLRDLESRNYHAIVKATGRNPEEIR
jgi:RNA polymerase sigma-54 factor